MSVAKGLTMVLCLSSGSQGMGQHPGQLLAWGWLITQWFSAINPLQGQRVDGDAEDIKVML